MDRTLMHRKFFEQMDRVRDDTTQALLEVIRRQETVNQQVRALFLSGDNAFLVGNQLLAMPELQVCWPRFKLGDHTRASIIRLLEKELLTPAEIEARRQATIDRVATEARSRMQRRLQVADQHMLTPADRERVLSIAIECRTLPRQRISHIQLAERLTSVFGREFTSSQARAALKNSLRLWRTGKLSLSSNVAREYLRTEQN